MTAYRNAAPSLMTALPALMGAILLLITVPSILAFLNTETRLIGGYPGGALDVQSDCDDLKFDVIVQPYSTQGSDPDYAWAPSVELSFHRREPQAPPGLDDEGSSPMKRQSFRERFGRPNCRSAVVTVKSPGVSKPSLVGQAFADEQVEELAEGRWRVSLKDSNHRQSLTFDWPGLYAYSQDGFGWINARLDDFASGISFLVSWSGESKEQGLLADAGLILFSPPGFNVEYARELDLEQYGQTRRSQSNVEYSMRALETKWGNTVQPLRVITGAALFSTEDFEAKQNFTLLVGGAMLGLGITLLVESLIAVIFRIERRLRRRREEA